MQILLLCTGKSLSEALIFPSINPQYDCRLFMASPVQYMKTTSAEHGLHMCCTCSFYGNSMNNLLSYCGLIDGKIRASDKDLPVPKWRYCRQHHVWRDTVYKTLRI